MSALKTLKTLINKSLMPNINKLPLRLVDKSAINLLKNLSNCSISNNTGKNHHISLFCRQVGWVYCLDSEIKSYKPLTNQ
ncbi:hypothetical protein NIES4106_39590 [Fischerella sp. NIES-4106]|nr:hypothetical protein NIES4106_39590 [Fischerella sp. NIES-4106]